MEIGFFGFEGEMAEGTNLLDDLNSLVEFHGQEEEVMMGVVVNFKASRAEIAGGGGVPFGDFWYNSLMMNELPMKWRTLKQRTINNELVRSLSRSAKAT